MSTGNSGGSCSEGWKAVWFYGTEEQPRTRLSSCYGPHSSRFSIVSIHPMLNCLYCETSWSAAGTRKSLNPVLEKQESQTELILIFVHFSQYLLHNPFGVKEVQGGDRVSARQEGLRSPRVTRAQLLAAGCSKRSRPAVGTGVLYFNNCHLS